MPLKITTHKQDTTLICVLEGAVDTESAPLVEDWVKQAFLAGAKKLVFDLALVPYVASAGLGAFVKAMKSFPGSVALAAPVPYVAQTLRLSALDRLGKICPTVEDALKG
jgi:anti-anti-sigma factor